MANLNIKQEKFALPNGSYCIIQKLGGHIDVSTLELFEQGLAHLLSNNINQLVLNLTDVTYISSSGMGLLIKYVEKFRESGGDIQISCVTPGIWTIFKQIGLNSVFGIFSSDKEALSAFRERANYNPITRARYPAKFKCPSCAGALEIGQPGKYRCIHCGTYFSAESTGAVKAFISQWPKIIEAKLSTNSNNTEWIKMMVEQQARWVKLPDAEINQVISAVNNICGLVTTTANPPNTHYRLIIIVNRNNLTIGFIYYDIAPVSSEIQKQELNQKITRDVDKLEITPLTPKGQIIKLVKELKPQR